MPGVFGAQLELATIEVANLTPAAQDALQFFKPGAGAFSAIGRGSVAPTAANDDSLAHGSDSHTVREQGFAVGLRCNATERQSFAQGRDCLADGLGSFAQGRECTANRPGSFAQGHSCYADYWSFAQGYYAQVLTTANSFAQGFWVRTYGPSTLVQGSNNFIFNNSGYSLVQGGQNRLGFDGRATFAFIQGYNNRIYRGPVGDNNRSMSFVQGRSNTVGADNQHCMLQGEGNVTGTAVTHTFAQGEMTGTLGSFNMLQGQNTVSTGIAYSFIQGKHTGTLGSFSMLQGNHTLGTGNSHCFFAGETNSSPGTNSRYLMMVGKDNSVNGGSGGRSSFVLGLNNTIGNGAQYTFCVGENNYADWNSICVGYNLYAAQGSFAQGYGYGGSGALGYASFSQGGGVTVAGNYSFGQGGWYIQTYGDYTFAQGWAIYASTSVKNALLQGSNIDFSGSGFSGAPDNVFAQGSNVVTFYDHVGGYQAGTSPTLQDNLFFQGTGHIVRDSIAVRYCFVQGGFNTFYSPGDYFTSSRDAFMQGYGNKVSGDQAFIQGYSNRIGNSPVCMVQGYDNRVYNTSFRVFCQGGGNRGSNVERGLIQGLSNTVTNSIDVLVQGNSCVATNTKNAFVQGAFSRVVHSTIAPAYNGYFAQGNSARIYNTPSTATGFAGTGAVFTQGRTTITRDSSQVFNQGSVQDVQDCWGVLAQGAYCVLGDSNTIFAQGQFARAYNSNASFVQGNDLTAQTASYSFLQGYFIESSRVVSSFNQGQRNILRATGASFITDSFAQGTHNWIRHAVTTTPISRAFVQGRGGQVFRDDQKTWTANRYDTSGVRGDAQSSHIIKWVETSDATTTTLATLDLEEDKSYSLKANLIARRTDVNGDNASFVLAQALAYRDTAGAAVLIGGPVALTSSTVGASAATWAASLVASGNDILLQVTGAAGPVTVEWCGDLEFVEVAG
jgi:hypothetical protein